jgi:mannose-6-phosphate isomerase-like protein (cupin superfamily)
MRSHVRASVLTLALGLCAATGISAQAAPSAAQHVSAAQLRDTVADAATLPAGFSARLLGNRGAYTYLAIRRDRTGEVEVHAGWDDVMVVETGTATLLYGGSVSGGRQTAPGERRGGSIGGGTAQTLAPGDVMVIPAGVPHQVRVPEGGSVTYFVVKVAPGPPPAR